jgi:MYXO-CTERM domain-containing protein
LSFGVQEDGSVKRKIPWEQADSIIRLAFQQWLGANCEGGTHPTFSMFDLDEASGPIICDQPEFNKTAPNANVWMFRDDTWPYVGVNSTLALTTITFEVPTGKILDADVEINSFRIENLSTNGTGSDLQSIITHEAGHFLGLAHSTVRTATMSASYQPGEISFRSLDPDDQAGVCAIYPIDREAPICTQPAPRHGFSRYCGGGGSSDSEAKKGCSVTREPARGDGPALAALAALGMLVARRRVRALTR